jgi:hypothetical protein
MHCFILVWNLGSHPRGRTQIEGDDAVLLGCDVVWLRQATSGLGMETASFSKTLVSTYEFIRRQNPERLRLHRRENLKFQTD